MNTTVVFCVKYPHLKRNSHGGQITKCPRSQNYGFQILLYILHVTQTHWHILNQHKGIPMHSGPSAVKCEVGTEREQWI